MSISAEIETVGGGGDLLIVVTEAQADWRTLPGMLVVMPEKTESSGKVRPPSDGHNFCSQFRGQNYMATQT